MMANYEIVEFITMKRLKMLKISSEKPLEDAFSKQRIKENLGKMFVSYF